MTTRTTPIKPPTDEESNRLSYVGELLKQFRLAQGKTQQEVANESGLGRNTVQKAEHGSNITLSTLFRFVDEYNLTLEDFFTDME